MLRIGSGEILKRVLYDSYEIDVALQLTVEDDFLYFCTLDNLAQLIVKPDTEFPAIDDSCYISREEVFS